MASGLNNGFLLYAAQTKNPLTFSFMTMGMNANFSYKRNYKNGTKVADVADC
jgi:hypothetical protein